MESLPVLPLELLGLASGESALEPASRRPGATSLFPRGSPEGAETGAGLDLLSFANLLPLPAIQANGGELPSGGKNLPPAPQELLPTPALSRAAPLEIESITGRFRLSTDESLLPQSSQPLPSVAERRGFGPWPGETQLPPTTSEVARVAVAEHGAKVAEAVLDEVRDLLPPRPTRPLNALSRPEVSQPLEIESTDLRVLPSLHSLRDVGDFLDSAKDRGLRALSELRVSADTGRLTESPLPESRGLLRAVNAIAGVELNGALPPATQAPTTASTPLPELTTTPVPAESLNMTAARWGDAVANRLSWMIDSDLGEARIKLNPPELGALDVKISMVEEKAFVQLFASEPAAKELLESALPKLRELLGAGGIELAEASVNDRKRGLPDTADNDGRSQNNPDAEPQDPLEVRVKRTPSGRIDLYA